MTCPSWTWSLASLSGAAVFGSSRPRPFATSRLAGLWVGPLRGRDPLFLVRGLWAWRCCPCGLLVLLQWDRAWGCRAGGYGRCSVVRCTLDVLMHVTGCCHEVLQTGNRRGREWENQLAYLSANRMGPTVTVRANMRFLSSTSLCKPLHAKINCSNGRTIGLCACLTEKGPL